MDTISFPKLVHATFVVGGLSIYLFGSSHGHKLLQNMLWRKGVRPAAQNPSMQCLVFENVYKLETRGEHVSKEI